MFGILENYKKTGLNAMLGRDTVLTACVPYGSDTAHSQHTQFKLEILLKTSEPGFNVILEHDTATARIPSWRFAKRRDV